MRIPNATATKAKGVQATPEETFATLRSSGRALTDDELDQVSGGIWNNGSKPKCPKCCSENIGEAIDTHTGKKRHQCRSCGRVW